MRAKATKLLSVVLLGMLILTLCLTFGPVQADTQGGSAVIFGPSRKYRMGMTPSVSMWKDGRVIEVHKAQSTIAHHDYLWYNVGLGGGGSHYASGYEPTVSVGSDGTVVAIHRDNNNWTYYQVGKCNYDNWTVDWGPIHQFGGKAERPIVGVNGKGDVVEAYQIVPWESYYRVGKVDPVNKTIDWGDAVPMPIELVTMTDSWPSIDINDNGTVVASYVANKHDTCNWLYCRPGTVNVGNKTIDWGNESVLNYGMPYDNNYASHNIEVNNDGCTMAVYGVENYGPGFYNLYYQVGQVDPTNKNISWVVSEQKYDEGCQPDVGLGDDGTFVEMHRSQTIEELYYHTGNIHSTVDTTDRDWGTASGGVQEPATEWFLAEGCTAPGFENWILVQNPGTEDANVHLTYMTAGGQVKGPSQLVKAGTRATFNVAETVPDSWEVATKVDSDKPVVAERAMYGSNRAWATNSAGVTESSNNWLLAEGCTAPSFETWVLVVNPGTKDANVHLTYMTDKGVVEGPSRVVKAGTRATFNAAETVGSVWEFSTRVTSDEPVVAERAMYGTGRSWGANSAGVTGPSTVWFLAEGCTGDGFETWILVANPGTENANVNVTYMTPDGTTRNTSAVVKAHTRVSFNAAGTIGSAWELSMKVTSDEPVVAERAMYGSGRTWATCSTGTPQANTQWYLAEGCTASGFETWVLLQNPGTKDADVKVTYMTQYGEVEGPSITLKAGSRATLNAAQTVGSTWQVSTKVTSDEPIVVEKAIYGNDL